MIFLLRKLHSSVYLLNDEVDRIIYRLWLSLVSWTSHICPSHPPNIFFPPLPHILIDLIAPPCFFMRWWMHSQLNLAWFRFYFKLFWIMKRQNQSELIG